MTAISVERKSKSGKVYHNILDEKRIKGKVVQKYVGYLGISLNSKNEIEPEEIVKYVSRFLDEGISQEEIDQILKKIGIDYDAWPITKIIIENDLKMKKVFLKLK